MSVPNPLTTAVSFLPIKSLAELEAGLSGDPQAVDCWRTRDKVSKAPLERTWHDVLILVSSCVPWVVKAIFLADNKASEQRGWKRGGRGRWRSVCGICKPEGRGEEERLRIVGGKDASLYMNDKGSNPGRAFGSNVYSPCPS